MWKLKEGISILQKNIRSMSWLSRQSLLNFSDDIIIFNEQIAKQI